MWHGGTVDGMKWFKRVTILTLMATVFVAGYEYGRDPSVRRARRLTAGARAIFRRLWSAPTGTRVLSELRVIRGQTDRILRQNERIYVQNDRILEILEHDRVSAPLGPVTE